MYHPVGCWHFSPISCPIPCYSQYLSASTAGVNPRFTYVGRLFGDVGHAFAVFFGTPFDGSIAVGHDELE